MLHKSPLSLLLFVQVATPTFFIFRRFVMKFISTSTVALSILLSGGVRAAMYNVADTYERESFFSGFDFYSAPDPTHGRV